MQNFIKRFALHISSIFLVLALAAPANALLPAVLLAGLPEAAIWGSALFHAAAIGTIAYFSLSSSGSDSHKVNTSTGDIGRTANVAWVEWDSDGKQFMTMQSPASVKVPFNTVNSKAASSPDKYPKLKTALSVSSAVDTVNPTLASLSALSVGSVASVQAGSYPGYYTISSKIVNTTSLSSSYTSMFHDTGYPVTRSDGTYSDRIYVPAGPPSGSSTPYNLYILSGNKYTGAVTSSPATPAQFASAISVNGGITDTSIQSEIDEMIKEYDNDNYSFSVLDTSSASSAASSAANPVSLPASALSSSQVNQIKADQAYKDSVTQAWKNYSTSKSPADAQKYLDAVAADASNTAQSDSIADGIKKYDDEQKASMTSPSSFSLPDNMQNPVPDGDYYGYLQLDRFNSVASTLLTKQPFAYLSSAKSYLTNWSSGQGAPVFTFDFPILGQSHLYTVDLSPWDGTAKVIRYLFGIGGFVSLGAYFRGLLAGGRS